MRYEPCTLGVGALDKSIVSALTTARALRSDSVQKKTQQRGPENAQRDRDAVPVEQSAKPRVLTTA